MRNTSISFSPPEPAFPFTEKIKQPGLQRTQQVLPSPGQHPAVPPGPHPSTHPVTLATSLGSSGQQPPLSSCVLSRPSLRCGMTFCAGSHSPGPGNIGRTLPSRRKMCPLEKHPALPCKSPAPRPPPLWRWGSIRSLLLPAPGGFWNSLVSSAHGHSLFVPLLHGILSLCVCLYLPFFYKYICNRIYHPPK